MKESSGGPEPEEFGENNKSMVEREVSSSSSSNGSGTSNFLGESEDLEFDDDGEYGSEFDYGDSAKSFSSLICSTNEYLKAEEEKNNMTIGRDC